MFAPDYFARLATLPQCDAVYGPKLSRDAYRTYYRCFAGGQPALHRLGIPAASGSNLLLTREAFRRVGGFDLELPCNEDSELVWRVHRTGYLIAFEPELFVTATDHRRLQRGVALKTAHSLVRCALLWSGCLPRRWRNHDWGYWSDAVRPGQDRADHRPPLASNAVTAVHAPHPGKGASAPTAPIPRATPRAANPASALAGEPPSALRIAPVRG